MKRQLTYIEHFAGEFVDGLQVCAMCGAVITDYTGNWVSSDGVKPKGFPHGPIYTTGINPVQWTTVMPEESFGINDPFVRTIKSCLE